MNHRSGRFACTRGPVAELARFFFLGLVRSESFAGDDTFTTWLVQLLALLVAASWMLPVQLFRRYLNLHSLPSPEPYLAAYSGDTLWCMILMSLIMALVTLMEWNALFPSRRDHLVLSPLPLTGAQIFAGKILAVGLFFTSFLLGTTVLSSVALPLVSIGQWEHRGSAIRIAGLLLPAIASGYFSFLALAGLQGLLSLLIPPRWFPAVSSSIQIFFLLAALCSFPVLPYLPSGYLARMQSHVLVYFPPAWFWGWGEMMLGGNSGFARELAHRAGLAFSAAFLVAAFAYLLTYLRLTRQSMETLRRGAPRVDFANWTARFFREPAARAVGCFILQTLPRARQQKLVFILIAGAGFALIVENSLYLGLHSVLRSQLNGHGVQTAVIALPLTLTFFAMVGLRRVFRIPAELEANWIFRFFADPAATPHQLSAVFHTFVLIAGFIPLLLAAPLQILTFRAGSFQVLALEACSIMTLAEYLMRGQAYIPFTYQEWPGKHLIHSLLTHFLELSVYSFCGTEWIFLTLRDPIFLVAFLSIGGGACAVMRARRIQASRRTTLRFEMPDPLGIDTLQLNAS